MLIRSASALRR